MTCCLQLNSITSLLAGMNMSPVSRLKKTWGKAKTAKFFILEVKKNNPAIHRLRNNKTGNHMKLTVFCLLAFALTASDGSYRKLLQLQDGTEGGRPSLTDCQQQQRKGRARRHVAALTLTCWRGINHLFSSLRQLFNFLPAFSL